MSHDFAKKRADRDQRSSKPPSSPWMWLSSGIFIGVFLSFLVQLTLLKTPDPETAKAVSRPSATAAKPAPTERPRFDFYTLLPESEVIVGDRPQTATGTAKTPDNPAAVDEMLLLQAGSFKQMADANRLRAELILLGYTARVETVTGPGGENWYRVLLGPFSSTKLMSEARKALLDQGMTTLELSKRPA